MRDRVARGLNVPLGIGVALLLPAVAAMPARAQLSGLASLGGKEPISRNEPVTFTADQVSYDRENGIVTASGHVEAWQNDHVLRADKITFDRNTNVAAASGHVVLLEPDGQVLFSDYAELSEGMRNGVLRGMRALLAQNGKLAANGARRTEGKINELSRVVYSTCNLCKEDPTKPPLWQIRALSAVQDAEHKRIEYSDAEVEMWGSAGRLLSVFLARRPLREAGERPAHPLDRDIEPYRRVRFHSVLRRAGRSIGSDRHAAVHDRRRPEPHARLPPPLQRRRPDRERIGRLSRATASRGWSTPRGGSPGTIRGATASISSARRPRNT